MREVLRVTVMQDDEGCGHVRMYSVDSYGALTEVTSQYDVAIVQNDDDGATGLAILKNQSSPTTPSIP